MSGNSRDSLIHHPVSFLLAATTVTLWGGNAVAGSFAVDTIPPIAVGGIRFAMATLFMLAWCWWEKSPVMLHGKQWSTAWWLGALLFLQIATFHLGLDRTSSSNASLHVNSYVFWVAAWEHYIAHTNRMRWWQLMGLLLASIGCATLLFNPANAPASAAGSQIRDQVTLAGDLILLLSGFILAIKIMVTKRAVQDAPVAAMIMWHNLAGTVLFALTSWLMEDHAQTHFTPVSTAALLYSGFIVSGFCFGVNAWLLKRHGASQVSVFSFATPLCGVVLGVLLRGDQLTPWLFAAGLLVGAGILLVNLVPSRPLAE